MPALAVASSKRIGPGALVCVSCAITVQDNNRTQKSLTLVPSCARCRGSGQVCGRGGFQQSSRNGVVGCGLRPGMASHADALFAVAHPEISRLALQCLPGRIEQLELQRLFARSLNEE